MEVELISTDLADLPLSEEFSIREDQFNSLRDQLTRTRIETSAALERYVPDADSFQQAVIESTDITLRVVAPAGSGKTQTMINRVISRIKQRIRPDRILLLTFDNAALQSLKKCFAKIKKESSISDVEGINIATLNSFGYQFLRQHVPSEYKQVVQKGRPQWFIKEVLTELDKKYKEVASTIPSNIKRSYLLELFSVLKNELYDPREFDAQQIANFLLTCPQAEPLFKNAQDKKVLRKSIQAIIWLYRAYELVLRRERVMDFDDQKLRAFIALEQNESICNAIQNSYSEIVVDEFQDINKLDFEFIKTISKKAILIVTGDDDQAIYGFRGCTPDYIIDLEKHLGRPTNSFELNVNYRCPANIVRMADNLIRHNKRRIIKNPIPFNKQESSIKVLSSLSAGIEARLIVSIIKKAKKEKPDFNYSDIAVLYRTNAQSLPLQVEFILNEIPYYVRDEDNILGNEILEKLLGILRCKMANDNEVNPNPRDSIYAVECYFRFVGKREIAKLASLFSTENSFLSIISSKDFFNVLPKAEISKFPEAINEFLMSNSLLNSLEVLSKRFRGLEGMIGSLEDVIEEKVPLGEIFEIAYGFKGNISDFVQTLSRAIATARSTAAGKDEETGVKLLTYFKSKGLQWHTVILTTCNEGLIPHKKAKLEDERRLFYVALTRAQKNLFISYVRNACKTKVSPSRFLSEAGISKA